MCTKVRPMILTWIDIKASVLGWENVRKPSDDLYLGETRIRVAANEGDQHFGGSWLEERFCLTQ